MMKSLQLAGCTISEMAQLAVVCRLVLQTSFVRKTRQYIL